MKQWKNELRQAVNPYLPSWEYIPDGEPYVFGDRVYVYGSHDKFNAPIFCVNDYVCWSAPVNDLSNWTCSETIFSKKQDPMNFTGLHLLFAPDVVRGVDGRFYLYYAFDFLGTMGVAVCDSPDGRYEFYGHVHYKDGTLFGRRKNDEFPFDPGVLVDDDDRVYLYSGFATKVPAILSRFHSLKNSGGVIIELESDMVTIKAEPKLLFPRKGNNPPDEFAGHEFFEASSIRKIDGKYVFVYSSANNHELCYAISDRPDGGFKFGGTLVDQGDLYLNGNEDESRALNYLGNTHGGMVELGDDWYIFYHRQTNQHSYSRQACAEKLARKANGGFRQAEVTSCGLNNGPLKGTGIYPSYIACNLWAKEGTARYDKAFPKKDHPYFTQNGKDGDENAIQYIANMKDGAVAGFKYFDMDEASQIKIWFGGTCKGQILVSYEPEFGKNCAVMDIDGKGECIEVTGALESSKKVSPLYFKYVGSGAIDFYGFELK